MSVDGKTASGRGGASHRAVRASTISEPCTSRGAVAFWLAEHHGHALTAVELLDELCRRLMEDGVPLWRVSVGIRTLHAELMARNFVWTRENGATEILRPHSVEQSQMYRYSPAAIIFAGGEAFRRRLDGAAELDFPLLRELREGGGTDYVVMPLRFSGGQVNYISWATDRPGGFGDENLARIDELLPLIALRFEIDALRTASRSLLETYLGTDAARQVLAGTVKRGEAHIIRAAIWYSDLRGFTAMADALSPDALITVLDDYFETVANPIHDHGGEILKFVGDGVLAIFKLEADRSEGACRQALEAALDAVAALDRLNQTRIRDHRSPLKAGIALHLGDVMYGNVGARKRLDFTVIGPAVNQVVRMEHVCSSLGIPLVTSDEFRCGCANRPLVSLGHRRLAGLKDEIELFTVAPAEPPSGQQ